MVAPLAFPVAAKKWKYAALLRLPISVSKMLSGLHPAEQGVAPYGVAKTLLL